VQCVDLLPQSKALVIHETRWRSSSRRASRALFFLIPIPTGEFGRLVIALSVSVAIASPIVSNSLRQRELRASPMLEGLRVSIGTPGSTDGVEEELRVDFFIINI
jgi:hypothetical protein